jgi:precorrin-2 dehydrogenase/sirohydrochlorin ferrochelatase
MKKKPAAYYPIFLNLSGRRCVVVGGGDVALRKTRTLVDYGAEVRVISPDCCKDLLNMAEKGQIAIEKKSYQRGDLTNELIVVAATNDSSINHRIADEAREKGILINAVDDADNSDFIVPSCLKRGDVTIAVSTSGNSPALARKIRSQIENDIGTEYGPLAILINGVRKDIKKLGIEVDGENWQKALDLKVLTNLIKTGNEKEARTILVENLKRMDKSNAT